MTQLKFTEHNFKFNSSKCITTPEQEVFLLDIFGDNKLKKVTLKYQGSRDGWMRE